MSSLSKSEGEGEDGDQSVPKWERELKAGLKREKKNPEWFQEERVLLAEAEYVSLGEKILDRRRAPECFLGDRKSSLLFGWRCPD